MKHEQIILKRVSMERERQDALVADGNLPFNCLTIGVPPGDKLMVLGEEFGEVSKSAYEFAHDTSKGKSCQRDRILRDLQIELIQLAACAVAWAESIEEKLS